MLRSFLLLAVVLLPAGCGAAGDPFARSQTWRPLNDNDANLRAMLTDPRDLVEGRAATGSVGAEASPPITRLLTGNRYPLSLQSASGSARNLGQPQAATPQSGGNAGGTP